MPYKCQVALTWVGCGLNDLWWLLILQKSSCVYNLTLMTFGSKFLCSVRLPGSQVEKALSGHVVWDVPFSLPFCLIFKLQTLYFTVSFATIWSLQHPLSHPLALLTCGWTTSWPRRPVGVDACFRSIICKRIERNLQILLPQHLWSDRIIRLIGIQTFLFLLLCNVSYNVIHIVGYNVALFTLWIITQKSHQKNL